MQHMLGRRQKVDLDKEQKHRIFSMVYYKLSSDPNFTFEVSPEGVPYRFTMKSIRGLMYCTIETIEGRRISGPKRICNGEWLIPYDAYNFNGMGNFMCIDCEGQYPDFERFETSCELRYYTKDEIEELEKMV